MKCKFSFLLLVFSILLIFPVNYCPAADDALSFGLQPYSNPVSLHQKFEPLTRYLTKTLHIPVKITISPNYNSHVMRIGQGKIDIAFLGPSPYVKAKDKFGDIELLAKFQMADDINDKVVIISNNSQDIQNLKDLLGRTFAFGDYHSFGSHFMPRYILSQHNIFLTSLAAYDYVGSHDNVVLAIQHGDFDAGGIRYDIFQKYQDRPIRVIYGPVPIPPHVLVCRSSLPEELKNNLREALLSLKDEHILKNINKAMLGFAPVSDMEFSLARKVVDMIESK